MPIYEYRCSNCDYEFENLQSMKDEALLECPNCHQNTLKKLISGGAGLIFKGSGFYITDYKSSKSKSKEKTDSKESSEKKKTPVPETPKETKTARPKTKD